MADTPPSRSPARSSPSASLTAERQTQAAIVAHQAETTIEAGDSSSDGHATDTGSTTSTTSTIPTISTSISSSARDFSFENGRRYHKFREGRYQLPNDETEMEREDMKHAMVVNLCGGKLHFAPLDEPRNIIDIGTGTGIWAIDVGDEYPSAQVLGIDLSPIQPLWVPPNVKFMVDDAESPWLHPSDFFDFVHIRHMSSAIKDWPGVLEQAHKAMKPGAWIELQELDFQTQCDDDTMKDDYIVSKFLNLVKEGLAVFGVDLLAMRRNAEMLQAAGFVNVQEKIFKVPLGTWPRHKTMKLIGLYLRSVMYDGLQGISMGPFTRALSWTPAEVELYLVGVRKELMNSSTHSYIPFHVVYGQKAAEF